MKRTYKIAGMTCNNCIETVSKALTNVDGISDIKVDLENNEATLTMNHHVDLITLKKVLPAKYEISLNGNQDLENQSMVSEDKTKMQQLKPLFIILGYIAVASFLLHLDNLNLNDVMIDFMGLFFIVFSFFKILDVKGFAVVFSMYDPISKLIPLYAKIYPIIETVLGLMFLFRYKIDMALISTIIVLWFTTYGVSKTLLSKRKIKCACLGTALNLPMTEATFIENALMLSMAIIALVN